MTLATTTRSQTKFTPVVNFPGVCEDLQPGYQLESGSEDPRVFYFDDYYWNFYYAPGSGLYTVKLAKTKVRTHSHWHLHCVGHTAYRPSPIIALPCAPPDSAHRRHKILPRGSM